MRLFLQTLLACLLFLGAQFVCAQEQSQVNDVLLNRLKEYPRAYSLFVEEKISDAVQELQSHLEQNENDAQFFNLLGVLQLKQKHYAAASTSFERAVLIEPSNAGSWMDLAIATLESGNYEVAQSYFDYIELNFNPPDAVKRLIGSYKKRIQLAQQVSRNWQNIMEFQVGRDTNANSGLQSAFIPITLEGDKVNLPLDPAFKARADNFAQLGIGTKYRRVFSTKSYEFGFSAKHRGYKNEHAFTSTDFASNIGVQSSIPLGLVGVNVYGDFNSLNGKGLMRNTRFSASLERAWRKCRYGFGVEVEWRRYVTLSGLNANVSWAQLAGACEQLVADIPLQIALITRIGIDKPVAARAGGVTRRREMLFQFGTRLSPRIQLDLSVNFSNAYDSEGYSPLLENNANRTLYRRNYRAQLTTPVSTDLDLFLKVDRNLINSNLLLFVQSGNTFNLGLVRRF